MRRLLLTSVVALVTALGVAAPAIAADVTVVGPRNGGTQTVSFASLAQDVDGDYAVRDGSGAATNKHVRGVSIAALLAAIKADDVYSGVEVVRADGSSVLVSKIQLLASGLTPAIYEADGQLWFIRPSYSSTDANAADNFGVAALTLRQVDLGALKVSLKADKKKVRARQLVRFEATASGAGAGQGYSFTWNFDDGTSEKGPEVSHRFSKRGSYRVLVAVKADGADRSDAKVVTVQVGDPVVSKKKRTGGGTNDSAAAPATGAADGDQGSGDQASTEASAKKKSASRRGKTSTAEPKSTLPRVEGELLSATVAPAATPRSTLAARSGSQVVDATETGLSPEAAFGIFSLMLLAGGIAFELGAFSRIRRVLRPH